MNTAVSSIENKVVKQVQKVLSDVRPLKGHREAHKMTYDYLFSNKLIMIDIIRAGVPYSLFDLIQHLTPFTENEWAEILDMSTKSLQRYKTADEYSFKPIHSEKIIEIAEVTKMGLDVFGDMDKFRLWLNTPVFALGNIRPIELLKNSYGKEMVMGELTRINHGILV